MKEYFSDDVFKKRIFSFISDDRALLEGVKIGSEVSIRVKNEENRIIIISFRITRNAYLGQKTQWIYGVVLNMPDSEYHQIEIKLNKNEPKKDTIEVFLQAPPVIIKKLR